MFTVKYVIYKPTNMYYGGELIPYHNNISKINVHSKKLISNIDKLNEFKYTSTSIPNINNNVQLYPKDMLKVSPPTKYYSYDIRNTPNIIHNTKYPIIYNNNNDLSKYTNLCKID